MGNELWISSNTGIRRKGTTFKELQSLFIDKISTKYIYEPVYSCKQTDESSVVKETLKQKEFDIVGVIDKNNQIIGFAKREELTKGPIKNFTKRIEIDNIISDSTPISKLLSILLKESFIFVVAGEKIDGIITRADINKPIARIYLFGIISLFEMHLNFWINEYYKHNNWKNKLRDARYSKALEVYNNRKGKNVDLSLLECIQLADKRDILKSTSDFLKIFDFTIPQFKKLLKNIEKIRNELAHSQKSIISNLDWPVFVETITNAEIFLCSSEEKVEEKVRTDNKSS